MKRCDWCTDDPDHIHYHDAEWGVPTRDPQRLFEMLVLEGFQAGLSWITILKKRPRFRDALFGFDPHRLADMSDDHIDLLMQDAGIVRNRRKLQAARQNAQAWLRLDDPAEFIWSFVGGAPKINHFASRADVPASSPEAEAMSRALKKLGFNFVGPTICYAYMQAVGAVMDHTTDCHRYKALAGHHQSVTAACRA